MRKNPCAPAEDDRDRAERQQQVLSAISGQVKSPSTFLRLPWVSWNAPRALKSDMRGPALMALFADMASGGTGDNEVIETSLCEQTGLCQSGNLFVSDGAKRDAVRKLLEGS